MYLSTPLGKVFALDPVSGKQRWVRDVGVKRERYFGDWVSRGVSYWRDSRGKRAPRAPAHFLRRRRRAHGGAGRGRWEVLPGFRRGGVIDLVPLLRNKQSYGDESNRPRRRRSSVTSSSSAPPSPTTIPPSARPAKCARSMRVPARCAGLESCATGSRPILHTRRGRVRRASHGRRQHLVNHRGRSQARSRVPAYLEPRCRLLRRHAPRGQPLRQLRGRAARLDRKTGLAFPDRHHDLWDYDNASPPALITLPDGRAAVLQGTKTAQFFVLDRETGAPLFPSKNALCPRATSRVRSLRPRSRCRR